MAQTKTKLTIPKLEVLLPDGMYEVEIRPHRFVKPKSNRQVKTIFGLMIQSTIAQANDLGIDVSYFLKYLLSQYDPKGQGLTEDFLHELMYVICPTTSIDGRRTTLSKMSTLQAANLFERFRTIVAPMGIVIEDPDPNWELKKK
jgi:hypothetical protein